MTPEQIDAIKNAYSDLVDSLESFNKGEATVHNWEVHLESIKELERVFPFIKK